MCKFVGLGTVS